MLNKALHAKIYNFILILSFFLMPIWKKAIPVCIGLLLLNWLLEGGFANKFSKLFQWRKFLALVGFYIVCILGFFYSDDKAVAAFDIEVKLSLFLLPLIFSTVDFKIFKVVDMKRYAIAFIVAMFLACSYLFSYALNGFINGQSYNSVFFYSELFEPLDFHPSYYAMFLSIGVLFILFNIIERYNELSVVKRFLYCFLAFLMSVVVFFSSSKMGLLSLFFVVFAIAFYAVVVKRMIRLAVTVLIVAISFTALSVVFFPEFFGRIKYMVKVFENPIVGNKDAESSTKRIYAWKYGLEVYEDNWLIGVGNGDVKPQLLQKYVENDMPEALQMQMNAHNQFLQVAIASGLIGLLSLFAMLFAPLVWAVRKKNFLYTVFLLIFIMNCTVESMLETQAGVVFFALFNCIFYFSGKSNPGFED